MTRRIDVTRNLAADVEDSWNNPKGGLRASLSGSGRKLLAMTILAASMGVLAQPVQGFQSDPVPQAPMQTSGAVTAAPIQASGSVNLEPIEASGKVGSAPLQISVSENPALEAELAKLRAVATSSAKRGSTTQRNAAHASWVMGLLFLHGNGVAKDPAQAYSWFERANSLGEPLASAGLAWCEIEGCATTPNPAAARRWITRLRQVNVSRSEYLEWLMESRLAPLQMASPSLQESSPINTMNRDLLVRAANGGDIHARIELGLQSVTAKRTKEALAYFRSAAASSEVAAANASILQEQMRGPSENGISVSTEGIAASAEQTFASARRYHRGEGVPANYAEAIRLYRLAESRGSVEAHRMLALIASRPAANGQIDIAWMQQLSNVDVSRETPQLENVSTIRRLSREPTPLYDLIPPGWRKWK